MNRPSRLDLFAHDAAHPVVNTARLRFTGRPSLVLDWTTSGRTHRGEASPLPGFGDDAFMKSRAELEGLDSLFLDDLLARAVTSVRPLDVLFEATRRFESPSARFAVETVLLAAAADRLDRAPWQLLRDPSLPAPPERLPTSAVLDPESGDIALEAARWFEEGVRTFKVKVGHRLDRELEQLGALRRRFGASISLRVDPNSTWTDEEARALDARQAELAVEWLEDPAEEADAWRKLDCAIPLAADEVLVGEEPNVEFLDWLGVRALVLKPMALGGYSACLDWARIARASGRTVSVSHLFDGPVALDAAIELAFAVQSPGVTPGLGLHAGLAGWQERPRHATTAWLLRPEARGHYRANAP